MLGNEWYYNNIVIKIINVICELPLIKTSNGVKIRIREIAMPELNEGGSLFGDEKTQDLMNLLEPIFQKNANLIIGNPNYIKKWFLCINNPAWK
jgi:hypothetical protein